MRLIDADALPSALFKKHVHDGEELEPMMYFEDAVKVVENATTIDAIPVEWLHKKREQMIDAAQSTPEQAIAYVLWMWKTEQEAR